MSTQSEAGREVFAVGRLPEYELARKCAWCNTFYSAADELQAVYGAKVSHGICRKCQAEIEK